MRDLGVVLVVGAVAVSAAALVLGCDRSRTEESERSGRPTDLPDRIELGSERCAHCGIVDDAKAIDPVRNGDCGHHVLYDCGGECRMILPCDSACCPPSEPALALGAVGALEQARRQTMCVDAFTIANAMEMHHVIENGACPADVETLVRTGLLARMPQGSPSWSITCGENGPVVSAPGADGKLGTDDDVVHGGPRATCGP